MQQLGQTVQLISGFETPSSVILTEDLSHLIAVPHNGASDQVTGREHTKAIFYNFESNKVDAVQLKGLGEAIIHDAEIKKGRIVWLVRRFSDNSWLIMTSASEVISQLSQPMAPPAIRTAIFWLPQQDIIWFLRLPTVLNPDPESDLQLSLTRCDLGDGSRIEIDLIDFRELLE
ncbi:MAG: hypothetical protein CMJ46_08045 [Planctomyces sp.]|nr:hypothetical protein [Planctomyces sp.]